VRHTNSDIQLVVSGRSYTNAEICLGVALVDYFVNTDVANR